MAKPDPTQLSKRQLITRLNKQQPRQKITARLVDGLVERGAPINDNGTFDFQSFCGWCLTELGKERRRTARL